MCVVIQALECYLGNVIPLDGKEWSIESGEVLRQMVQGVVSFHLLAYVGLDERGGL